MDVPITSICRMSEGGKIGVTKFYDLHDFIFVEIGTIQEYFSVY